MNGLPEKQMLDKIFVILWIFFTFFWRKFLPYEIFEILYEFFKTLLYIANRVERQLSTINNSILFWYTWLMFSDSSEKMSLLTFHHIFSTLLCPSRYFTIKLKSSHYFHEKLKNSRNCKILESIHVRHIIKRRICTWNIFRIILLHLLCDFLP